jgi:hypothetical protein
MSGLFPSDEPPARRELREGERLTGTVLRLPSRGAFDGNRLVLQAGDGVVSIPATGRRSWSVLERELASVHVGDLITLHYVGWHTSRDGLRYRLVRVEAPLAADSSTSTPAMKGR